jgi:hypothetical protein
MAKRICWLTITVMLAIPVQAQRQDGARRDRTARAIDTGRQLIRDVRNLGAWDEQYVYLMSAVENVYERNDWTSDEDLFSIDLMSQIQAIPPWQAQDRLTTLTEIVRDRYSLSDDQVFKMHQLLIRDAVQLFTKHSDRISQYAGEFVRTRAAGAAITPEQVAKWVKLAEPVMHDARAQFRESAKEFEAVLDPGQREIFERDYAAANHRLDDIEKQTRAWKQGKWDPAEWGLDTDPIQLSGQDMVSRIAAADPHASDMHNSEDEQELREEILRRVAERRLNREENQEGDPAAGEARNNSGGGTEESARSPDRRDGRRDASQEVDEWEKYTRDFIARYKLDEAQTQRAWIIYRDLKSARERMEKRIDPRKAKLRADLAAEKDAKARVKLSQQIGKLDEPISRLFDRLKARLEKLPTRAQKEAAGPPPSEPDKKEKSDRPGKSP